MSISDGFRIFTLKTPQSDLPAEQITRGTQFGENNSMEFVVANKCIIDRNGDLVSGGGVWFNHMDNQNMSLKISEDNATNNRGLILTMLKATKTVPKDVPITIRLNSLKVIRDLSTNLETLENSGWLKYQNASPIKALVAELRLRSAPTILKKWDNSLSREVQEEVMALATSGILKCNDDEISIKIDRSFNLTGMKLKEGSQKLFYQGISLIKTPKPQRETQMKLAIMIHAVQELNGSPPTPEIIWKSIRDKDIPRSIRGFLWKCLHNVYKIGDHWSKILPNFENRSKCGLCGEEEMMEHIIFECDNSPVQKMRESHKVEGNEDKYHSKYEIHNKWIRTMNTKLKFDKILTDSHKFKKGALKESLVLNTWSGVLKDEQSLPENWIRKLGVLVGIAPRRPPGQNR
ncbi:hypothetical protein F4604DRAFT_1687575 [Suillus subluteus]|nr:hypothetical protein F4604DRAFT_1687575 [Suillus subluteus]